MTEANNGPSPWLLIPPVILTNVVAMSIQALWAYGELGEHWKIAEAAGRFTLLAILWAVCLESIGVYLSAMAHAARLADQSAGLLQLAAYGVGALMGALNYSHFADWTKPNAIAIGAGLASLISPWLWAIWSRYRSRARLAQLGQVDKRAVKLSTARKIWHPLRSLGVVRHATWAGVIEPDAAVVGWEEAREAKRARREAKRRGELTTGNAVRTAEAFPERDRWPVVRPVIIRQHRTTVRRQTVQITDRPAPLPIPRPEPPQSPWATSPDRPKCTCSGITDEPTCPRHGKRIEVEAYPVSPAGASRDPERMWAIAKLVAELGRVPGRDPVKARLKELGLGVGSNKADQLLARFRAEEANK